MPEAHATLDHFAVLLRHLGDERHLRDHLDSPQVPSMRKARLAWRLHSIRSRDSD